MRASQNSTSFADLATSRFEANVVAGSLEVIPDCAHHDKSNFVGGIHTLLAGAGLDEIGSSHHGHQACLVHIGHSAALSNGQDRLHMNIATRLFAGLDVLVQGMPISFQ